MEGVSPVQQKPTPRRVRVEQGVYQRPDGGYEIGWRDAGGRQRWRKVDGGIRAARAARAEEVARRGRGERVAADPRLKLADAADAWWDARVVRLRPTTQSAYRYGLRHLLEAFGRRRLVDITATDVAAYVMAKQREGLKGWTVKGHMTVLSSVFQHASRHLGYVGMNPVGLLDRVERPSSDDEKPKRILSTDERARLMGEIDAPYRALFQVAASTGARLGEVLGITWQEIDFTMMTITFTHQLDRKGNRVPLKTKRSRRCIEIGNGLATVLREQKLAAARTGDRDLVFVNRAGAAHDHRNIGGRVLARAVTAAGLDATVIDGKTVQGAPTFHSLRHTHASELIADGWNIEDVSRRLGHSNVATTQRIYVHAFEAAEHSDDRRRRLEALEAHVEATGGTSRHQTGTPAPLAVVDFPAAVADLH
jgi:integrase